MFQKKSELFLDFASILCILFQGLIDGAKNNNIFYQKTVKKLENYPFYGILFQWRKDYEIHYKHISNKANCFNHCEFSYSQLIKNRKFILSEFNNPIFVLYGNQIISEIPNIYLFLFIFIFIFLYYLYFLIYISKLQANNSLKQNHISILFPEL